MILEATAESWVVTMEMVSLDSRCCVVGGGGLVGERLDRDGGGRLGGDAYFECFADAENDTQSTLKRGFRLTRNKLNTPQKISLLL